MYVYSGRAQAQDDWIGSGSLCIPAQPSPWKEGSCVCQTSSQTPSYVIQFIGVCSSFLVLFRNSSQLALVRLLVVVFFMCVFVCCLQFVCFSFSCRLLLVSEADSSVCSLRLLAGHELLELIMFKYSFVVKFLRTVLQLHCACFIQKSMIETALANQRYTKTGNHRYMEIKNYCI